MPTQYFAPFALIHRDGKTREFETLQEVRAHVLALGVLNPDHYWDRQRLSDPFYARRMLGWKHVDGDALADWIVRDSYGTPVAPKEVWDAYPRRTYDRYREARHAASLGLPIPHTGGRGGGHYLRRNRHVVPYRDWYGVRSDLREDPDLIEVAHKLAPRRGKTDLPRNPWDDIPFARQAKRNWKRYRAAQWHK